VAGADRVVNNALKGASQVNKAEITFKNHGVTFEGITLLDAEEVQEAIQTIHSNFEAEITALEKRLSNAETMGDKAQSIRDLEQQAKGLKDFSITYNEMATNPDLLVNLLNYCANVLLGKAKALKEGK
jgi:hypothetical protein